MEVCLDKKIKEFADFNDNFGSVLIKKNIYWPLGYLLHDLVVEGRRDRIHSLSTLLLLDESWYVEQHQIFCSQR